jgi:DNA-binding response OmpR family regulator
MILIVDDDPKFVGAAVEALGKDEVVHYATDAPAAMHLLRVESSRFGVALVDLNLPGISGFDLIQAIRDYDAHLPIIAMSGVFAESSLETAKYFGATEALRKPFNEHWKIAIDRVRRYHRH